MFDPVITAHLRILDNLQTVVQRLITDLAHQQALPTSFTLACRAWLLNHMRTLALHQQTIAAGGGLGRRVAVYDDILYALCRDRDLIIYRAREPDTVRILRSMAERIEEIRQILLGFTPLPGRPYSPAEGACLAHLIQQESGPLSVPGALAGLAGWWTLIRSGSIELDLTTHQLTLNVAGSEILVNALVQANSTLCHLGNDIHVSWGAARGLVPRIGHPEVYLCDTTNKAMFLDILHGVRFLTARPPRDTPEARIR